MSFFEYRKAMVLIDPYYQRKFMRDPEYGKDADVFVHHSKYLSRLLNLMLYPIGDNVVVRGLQAETAGYLGTVVEVKVKPGMAVADHTLLEFPYETLIDLDVVGLDPNGYVVAVIVYDFGNRLVPNQAKMCLRWVSLDGSQTYPDDWDDSFNLVLGVFKFSLDQSGQVNDFWKVLDLHSLIVKGRAYDIYPSNAFYMDLIGEFAGWSESLEVTEQDVSRGYLLLNRIPASPEFVDLYVHNGLYLLNHNLVEGSNVSEPPDFAVFENRIIIRNGTYQGILDPSKSFTVSTLSDSIQIGDVLVAEYNIKVS
ncbi:MAG: hypothetical protein QW835_00280 [Candidatus Hadarchaeum sp.]